MQSTENTLQITLTEAAANAFRDLVAQRDLQGYSLRVFVAGSGCSGYHYGLSIDNSPTPNDFASEHYGVNLLVDDISAEILNGATIDYVENETGSGFKIDNPNASSNCGSGCGSDTSGCGCGCGC